MFYSVAAFERAGLTRNDVPTTWDGLLTIAHKLKTPKQWGIAFETSPGIYQNYTWVPFMWMGNGEVVTKHLPQRSAFNTQATWNALSFWQKSIQEKLAPRNLLGNGGGDLVSNLATGYCAIQHSVVPAIAAMKAQAPNFRYGIFRLPLPPGGHYTSAEGGWNLAVNANGKDPEGAARFVAWAMGTMEHACIQRCLEWTIATSDLPVRKSVHQLGIAQHAFNIAPAYTYAVAHVAPGARFEPRYTAQVTQAVSDAIQSTQLGSTDPRVAARQAAATIDSFLNGYTGAELY
jgi:multiple sugar transport system substrate-binding protein